MNATSQENKICPRCGAAVNVGAYSGTPHAPEVFLCESYVRNVALGPEFDQSDECRIAELRQQLAADKHADTLRLDWLTKHGAGCSPNGEPVPYGPGLRAYIDEQMTQ